uniref:Kinetochore protein SPC25 n=1 Tax=Anopheles farauti TaxID=69004 RepID=A0A182QXX6_9DIPT
MDRNESLSLAKFNQKLLKYCTNAAKCYTQEKELVSRFEKLITKRDTFLAQLIKDKEADMACAEQIVDLQHQHEEAQELLDNFEKKCNLLALEQMSLENVERPDKDVIEGTKHEDTVTNTSAILTEKLLNRFLAKYCNLFVQFSDSCDGVRVLSLTDNRYYEFSLNNSTSQLREDIWANLAASSSHLNIWENLL